MHTAIAHAGGELKATVEGDIWCVRIGELEERSTYLHYALSQLLDLEPGEVHLLAHASSRRFSSKRTGQIGARLKRRSPDRAHCARIGEDSPTRERTRGL